MGERDFALPPFRFSILCKTEGYFGVYALRERHFYLLACTRVSIDQSNVTAWQWEARGVTSILEGA